MSYLKKPDRWTAEIAQVFRDYEAGAVSGWPDRYVCSTVLGVRYLQSEQAACQMDLMEG